MRSVMDWVGALAMIGTVVGVERFLNRWGEWGEWSAIVSMVN